MDFLITRSAFSPGTTDVNVAHLDDAQTVERPWEPGQPDRHLVDRRWREGPPHAVGAEARRNQPGATHSRAREEPASLGRDRRCPRPCPPPDADPPPEVEDRQRHSEVQADAHPAPRREGQCVTPAGVDPREHRPGEEQRGGRHTERHGSDATDSPVVGRVPEHPPVQVEVTPDHHHQHDGEEQDDAEHVHGAAPMVTRPEAGFIPDQNRARSTR